MLPLVEPPKGFSKKNLLRKRMLWFPEEKTFLISMRLAVNDVSYLIRHFRWHSSAALLPETSVATTAL
jgi:hypothetical protein